MSSTATSRTRSGRGWLPTSPSDRRVRVLAWLVLATQLLIVGTGGAVRLTGSGLGCTTWPRCTEDSFIATPEMGIHGIIEFGNRTLFFVLQAVAILAFLSVWRLRRGRRDLFVLALVPCFTVVVQAVLGGITVWSGLNPYVVGLHFLPSVLLAAVAAAYVDRVYAVPGPRVRAVPGWVAGVTHLLSGVLFVTIVLGILTTGSGPHAGDAGAARNGLDSELLQHFHSWPAYVSLGLALVVAVFAALRGPRALLRRAILLLAVMAVQIVVGIWQARTGLPPILVGVHMVLACGLAAAMTSVVLALKAPAPARRPEDAPAAPSLAGAR